MAKGAYGVIFLAAVKLVEKDSRSDPGQFHQQSFDFNCATKHDFFHQLENFIYFVKKSSFCHMDKYKKITLRECNKPLPSSGGKSCIGADQEIRNCTGQPPCLGVNGNFIRSFQFHH